MEQNDFLKKMEGLKKPDVNEVKPSQQFKLVLMNSKKSAALGFWFIVVPCYFLFVFL